MKTKLIVLVALLASASAVQLRSKDQPNPNQNKQVLIEQAAEALAEETPAVEPEGDKKEVAKTEEMTENPDGSVAERPPTKDDMHLSGFNGGDEDEILEKIIKNFSTQGRDTTNNKTTQLMLSKANGKRAGEVALEACHKLKVAQVPQYIAQNFEAAWAHFDQNGEGWIRFEESHNFLKFLFGHLNKFVVAPGSITDLESGGSHYKLSPEAEKSKL